MINKDSKILITGGSGLVGQNLTNRLHKEGYTNIRVNLHKRGVRTPIEGMLITYNSYINARDSVFGNTESAQNYKDILKQRAKQELLRLSKLNRNAEDAYFALFSKLIRD